jgi:ubiquinone biosynthesis protein
VTAKPFLERWMSEQIGWRGFVRRMREEAPAWAIAMPQLPRLVHQALVRLTLPAPSPTELALLHERRRTNRLLAGISILLTALVAAYILSLL